jgi:hypothetical protein
MAYETKKLLKQAKEAIEKHKLIFVEDVISYLPIRHAAFYNHFKKDSEELAEIKELLEANKISMKVGMRSRWYESDAPALQMGLYKLIGTTEERLALSNNAALSLTHTKSEESQTTQLLVNFGDREENVN